MDVPSIDELIGFLGQREAAEVIDRFCAGGEASLLAFLDWLVVGDPPIGGNVNGRAVVEQQEELLSRLAAAHPDVLLERLAREPDVTVDFLMLAALSKLDHPAALSHLRRALESRFGSERWLALSALLRRADPTVTTDLSRFLHDRDHLVGFEAAKGLRLHGRPADVSALLDYADEAGTTGSIGGREAAFDAIETLCRRSGRPLPDAHPGSRLVIVEIPAVLQVDVAIHVSESLQVARGDLLAEVGQDQPLECPCNGVVVAIDREDGRPARIVIRRRGASEAASS